MKDELQLDERQMKLLEFVKDKHGDQKRKYTFEPYWTHVVSVATIVSKFVKHGFAVEVALCHDLLEDTECSSAELFQFFVNIGYTENQALSIGARVEELTDMFTKENCPELNREERKKAEANRLGLISSVAQSVKYADLIDNTSTIVMYDHGFAKVYLKEKLDILNPMWVCQLMGITFEKTFFVQLEIPSTHQHQL